MISETPAAALLDRYLMVDAGDAPGVWREYVAAVRRVAESADAPPGMAEEAKRLLAAGLSEDAPDPRPDDADDDEDPEGYGMDEPAEGEVT